MVVREAYVLAGAAGERLGHEERLREEALDLAGALHGELVLVGELVDAEDRDDVLELLVALEDLLDAGRASRSAPRRRCRAGSAREEESSGSTAG